MDGETSDRGENAPVLMAHFQLLQRLGWWDECERFLLAYGKDLLTQEELSAHLSETREKQRIYERISEPGPDGRTFIGDDDVVRVTKGPVSLVYHLKDRHLDVEHIYRSILRIVESVRDRLSYEPQDIVVQLHGEQSEIRFADSGDPGGSRFAGTYDGAIHLRASAFHTREPQHLAVMIAHEYVHQAVAELTGGLCPRWMDEGLALVFSQELSYTYETTLTHAIENARCFPVDALAHGGLFEADPEAATLAYAQSYSMVDYLRQRIGWDGIRRLLRLIRRAPAERALQEFSLNHYLLEKEWLRWARRKT